MSAKRRWEAQGIVVAEEKNLDFMDLDMGQNHVLGMEEEEEETHKRMKLGIAEGGRKSNGLAFPTQESTQSSEKQQNKKKGSDKEVLLFYKFF